MGRTPGRWLLLGGVVGPIAFVGLALAQGAVRPGYDPNRQFVSLLSLGEGGWLQIANFVVCGLLLAAFAIGLHRAWSAGPGSRWVPRLVFVVGIALIVSGMFVTDPAQGYPAGAPAGLPTSVSWHAGLHYLGALVVFVGLPASMVIAARREPVATRGWSAYSLAAGAVMIGGWLATFVLAGPDGTLANAGLVQRIAVIAGFQWLVAVALIELRRSTEPATVAVVTAGA